MFEKDAVDKPLTLHLENGSPRNRACQEARQVDYAHALVDVLVELPW
jgi:hypothetical protein